MQIGSTSLDVKTDVKLAAKPFVDENCTLANLSSLNSIYSNGSICTLNSISECSMMTTLIPYFSLATFLMTTLPWLLGAYIIFTRRKDFWDIFGSLTNTKDKKLRGAERILKQFVFLMGLNSFPITIHILLGSVQIFEKQRYEEQTFLKN